MLIEQRNVIISDNPTLVGGLSETASFLSNLLERVHEHHLKRPPGLLGSSIIKDSSH
jgi:hypothetical protein